MKIKLLILSFILSTSSFFAQTKTTTTDGDAILGLWITGSGKAKINITKYGEEKFGGKIIWLLNPNDASGKAKLDTKNPDKVKKANTIMGLNNLLGFTYSGKKTYEGGTIYDPENGKTYKCVMTLENDNILKVRGYIGITLIGRTDTWTRVKE
jgi:uncharacterized protein (DUF2147 family)